MVGAHELDMSGKVGSSRAAPPGSARKSPAGLPDWAHGGDHLARPRPRRASAAELAASAGGGEVTAMQLDVADPPSVAPSPARSRAAPAPRRSGEQCGRLVQRAAREPGGARSDLGYKPSRALPAHGFLLEALRAAGRARIVNVVSSMAGNYDAEDLEFARRKSAASRSRRVQAGPAHADLGWPTVSRWGITVNAAAPGFVRTAFNEDARA